MMVLLASSAIVHAQPQRCRDGLDPFNDPRNQDVICLPEVGRMSATLQCERPDYQQENFGQQIIPLGDIDGDSLADWIIGRVRCDTSTFVFYFRYPVQLLLFNGKRGELPQQENGIRIGLSEFFSSCKVVGVGDWDADNHGDIVMLTEVYGDTSSGNVGANYDLRQLVVFWGQSNGGYTVSDTTRLSNSRTNNWLIYNSATTVDVDHDSVSDLIVLGGAGVEAGKVVATAPIFLYRGHKGKRWGRDGVPHSADWRWWNPPPMNTLSSGDQDGDGYSDIFLINNAEPSIGTASVLYGRNDGRMPDTTSVETVDLLIANGKTSLFMDVTGDNIPELLVTSGSENRIKVFAGLKGQRLKEQYGPGHASLDTASPHWWKRPWAEIWEPAKFGGSWPGSYDLLYDLGDVDLDGIGDIVGFNGPWLTVYHTGNRLDSLIDAMVDCRAAGGGLDDKPKEVAVLGDIDGSGIPTIAVGINDVLYVKPSKDMPRNGRGRMLPDGTGPATVEQVQQPDRNAIQLRAMPNPANEEVQLMWNTTFLSGTAIITVTSPTGEEIASYRSTASGGHYIWRTEGIADGTYFLTLVTEHQRATAQVVLHHQ
jgi:hypothetical protein